MSDQFRLTIGGVEFFHYSNLLETVDDDNDPFLDLLFRNEDLVLRGEVIDEHYGLKGELPLYRLSFYYTYSTEAREIKERMKKIGYTREDIDQLISKLSGVPMSKIDSLIIYLDLLDNYEDYFNNKIRLSQKNSSSNREHKWGQNDQYMSSIMSNEMYSDLHSSKVLSSMNESMDLARYFAYVIDDHDVNTKVELDPTEMIEPSYLPDQAWRPPSIGRVSQVEERAISKTYMRSAWLHYFEDRLDLCYIEMIIALESSLNDLIERIALRNSKKLADKLNLNRMVKEMSLMDELKFTLLFLQRNKEFPQSLFNAVERAYNTRNNIIHREVKSLNKQSLHHSLVSVEKMITLLSGRGRSSYRGKRKD